MESKYHANQTEITHEESAAQKNESPIRGNRFVKCCHNAQAGATQGMRLVEMLIQKGSAELQTAGQLL